VTVGLYYEGVFTLLTMINKTSVS